MQFGVREICDVVFKAKSTMKVGKKTYTVKTNSKGKATFKITNLNKKGKFVEEKGKVDLTTMA